MAKIVEFLLWDNCNNHCRFCFLKNKNSLNSFIGDEERGHAIKCAHEYLNSDDFPVGSDVLLCGGELFDTKFTEGTKKEWTSFLEDLTLKAQFKFVDHIYVNTNLIYNINDELKDFLDKIESTELFDKLNFTTSYDPVGRYKTREDRKLFFDNIKRLHEAYPNLKIVANMIMTKPVCDLILSNQLSIAALQEQHNITINLIPYIILVKDLIPEKTEVMDTLLMVDREVPGYLSSYVPRFSVDHPRILLKYYHGGLQEVTSENNPCGHSVNFAKYSREGSCFVCDILALLEEVSCGEQIS